MRRLEEQATAAETQGQQWRAHYEAMERDLSAELSTVEGTLQTYARC